MPKIAIIVLNWKQPTLTLETIQSLKKIQSPNFSYHIYIVDNGSPDNSLEIFNKEYSKDKSISIVATGENLGYVGGNNYCIKVAQKSNYDYYLVINNDVLVKPDFLQKLVERAESDPKIGIVAPKIYFAPGYEFHKDRYKDEERGKVIWAAGGTIDWDNINGTNTGVDEVDHGQYDQELEPDFLSGCCLLIRKALIEKIGLFDEKYYLYMEDSDFSRRCVEAGYKLLYIPTSLIWHVNSGSSNPGSQLHNYFLTRNRLLFASRYAKIRTKFAIFRESLRVLLFDPSIWRKKGVMDFYLGKFGKGSWR